MKRMLLLCSIAIATCAAVTSVEATIHDVSIIDNQFVPSSFTVAVGDSIRWTNNGVLAHTVDSGTNCTNDGRFESDTLNPGDQFLYVVTDGEAGLTIDYYCDFHCQMGMTGSYTVEGQTPNLPASWGKIKGSYR